MNVYYTMFMSGGGEDGGHFAGDKAAKPVTTILVCVSIFVNVKILDSLKTTSGTNSSHV